MPKFNYAILGPFNNKLTFAGIRKALPNIFKLKENSAVYFRTFGSYDASKEALANALPAYKAILETQANPPKAIKSLVQHPDTINCIIVQLNEDSTAIQGFWDFNNCFNAINNPVRKTYAQMWQPAGNAGMAKTSAQAMMQDYADKAQFFRHPRRAHSEFMQYLHNQINTNAASNPKDVLNVISGIYQLYKDNDLKDGEHKIERKTDILNAKGSTMRRLNFMTSQLTNGEFPTLEAYIAANPSGPAEDEDKHQSHRSSITAPEL